jgi:DUF1365 family protein
MQIVPMRVSHARSRPRRNAFVYRVCAVAIGADDLRKGRKCALFSVDEPNLFNLQTRDYGDGKTNPVQWVRKTLDDLQVTVADGRIVLLTLPRILRYAFNPVSFWFCFDRRERLRAVLAEVNNTFGERHFYLCRHPDQRPIMRDDRLRVPKVFHVSPFQETAGEYRFAFECNDRRIAVGIDLLDETGLALTTTMRGAPRPLSGFGLVKGLASSPLQGIKVISLIHWQALKLALKGVPYRSKPPPPASIVTT